MSETPSLQSTWTLPSPHTKFMPASSTVDREAGWATVLGVAESQTQLSD